nr:MAG TPA: hypothetical protein [Caudoviricetes sp.]
MNLDNNIWRDRIGKQSKNKKWALVNALLNHQRTIDFFRVMW